MPDAPKGTWPLVWRNIGKKFVVWDLCSHHGIPWGCRHNWLPEASGGAYHRVRRINSNELGRNLQSPGWLFVTSEGCVFYPHPLFWLKSVSTVKTPFLRGQLCTFTVNPSRMRHDYKVEIRPEFSHGLVGVDVQGEWHPSCHPWFAIEILYKLSFPWIWESQATFIIGFSW